MPQVIVVGAGLVGCLASIFLARRGLEVTIYERSPDLRFVSRRDDRSAINLTLCHRGIASLKAAAAFSDIEQFLVPVYGRTVHILAGGTAYQPYGNRSQAIFSVRRSDLNAALLSNAARAGVSIRFNQRIIDLDREQMRLTVQDGALLQRSEIASCIIVADGASSAIRGQLHSSGIVRADLQVSALQYKTITLFNGIAGRSSIHVWPRGDRMAIAFPNTDGSHAVAFHLPARGQDSFETLVSEPEVKRFCEVHFPDLAECIHGSEISFLHQRPNTMVTVQCRPWNLNGQVLLIGDAAHALLPHYGQGANAGFEDCRLLDSLLSVYGTNWAEVFSRFERLRRPDISAIASLCQEHADELHRHVDSQEYASKLDIEDRIAQKFPHAFLPLYSMVAFSEMPYSAVAATSRVQKQIISELLGIDDIDTALSDPKFETQLLNRMPHYTAALSTYAGSPS